MLAEKIVDVGTVSESAVRCNGVIFGFVVFDGKKDDTFSRRVT
jgi:hypothetical protein